MIKVSLHQSLVSKLIVHPKDIILILNISVVFHFSVDSSYMNELGYSHEDCHSD